MAAVMRLCFRLAVSFAGFIDDAGATSFIDDAAAISFIDDSGIVG